MSKAIVKGLAPFFQGQAWCHKTQKINIVSLNDFKDKYLVLFFYPANFSFVCPTEITEFSRKSVDFRKINAEVIGCSTDSIHAHRTYIQQNRIDGGLGGLDIDLLADPTHSISKDYGVFDAEKGFALRGTFIIDTKQIIRHLSINDTTVGRNVDEYLRLVEAFQFNDKNGEVCPAKWQKGGATIDQENPSEYWKNHHAKQK